MNSIEGQAKEIRQLNAALDELKHQRQYVQLFVEDNLEEVKNEIGGVVGYRLDLTPAGTATLCKLIGL